jgi:hypothetical protein
MQAVAGVGLEGGAAMIRRRHLQCVYIYRERDRNINLKYIYIYIYRAQGLGRSYTRAQTFGYPGKSWQPRLDNIVYVAYLMSSRPWAWITSNM